MPCYFAEVSHELTLDQIDHLATITPYTTEVTIKDMVTESLTVALRANRRPLAAATGISRYRFPCR